MPSRKTALGVHRGLVTCFKVWQDKDSNYDAHEIRMSVLESASSPSSMHSWQLTRFWRLQVPESAQCQVSDYLQHFPRYPHHSAPRRNPWVLRVPALPVPLTRPFHPHIKTLSALFLIPALGWHSRQASTRSFLFPLTGACFMLTPLQSLFWDKGEDVQSITLINQLLSSSPGHLKGPFYLTEQEKEL